MRAPCFSIRPLLALLLMAMVCLPAAAQAKRSGDEQLTPRQYEAVTEARNLLDQDRAAEAEARLLPLAQGDEAPLAVLSHLAWAQSRAGGPDRAIATYQKAARLYPKDAQTLRNLGILLLDRNRFVEGAATLERAYGLQSGETREPALLALAASGLARTGRFDRALELLDRAEKDAGECPVPWTSLAVHCCLQLDRPDQALARSRTCVKRHPKSGPAWALLGRVLARNGDPLGGAAALETAGTLDPGLPSGDELAALYALGHAHAEAARCLADSRGTDAPYRRAEHLYLAQQNREALYALDDMGTRQDAATPEAHLRALRAALLRGRILLDMDRHEAAVRCLTEGAETPPGPKEGETAHRLRGAMLLMAGEIRWMERDWNAAARLFDRLATVPGFAHHGSSLAAGMRAMLREAAMDESRNQ